MVTSRARQYWSHSVESCVSKGLTVQPLPRVSVVDREQNQDENNPHCGRQ
jgi:hypothetical protein